MNYNSPQEITLEQATTKNRDEIETNQKLYDLVTLNNCEPEQEASYVQNSNTKTT
jgi:hypothetical protein